MATVMMVRLVSTSNVMIMEMIVVIVQQLMIHMVFVKMVALLMVVEQQVEQQVEVQLVKIVSKTSQLMVQNVVIQHGMNMV